MPLARAFQRRVVLRNGRERANLSAMGVWHWLLTVTGTNNTSGYWYGWWSGFASDLPEFAILALIWRKINCHAKGCVRIGLHHVDGTPYVTCRKHHPVHNGSAAATAEEIAAAHAAAQEASRRS